jgi:hypothetical protein
VEEMNSSVFQAVHPEVGIEECLYLRDPLQDLRENMQDLKEDQEYLYKKWRSESKMSFG